MKWPAIAIGNVPTIEEEHVDQIDKIIEENPIKSLDNPQAKETAPVKAYVPLVPFSQRL